MDNTCPTPPIPPTGSYVETDPNVLYAMENDNADRFRLRQNVKENPESQCNKMLNRMIDLNPQIKKRVCQISRTLTNITYLSYKLKGCQK